MPQRIAKALAFKAYEIEELADIGFFRPLGAVIAHLAAKTVLTPNHLTFIGIALGMSGGTLLYLPGLALWGFALLIAHSIFDSADGQLARLTHRFSAAGRVMDGVGDYLVNISVFLAIGLGAVRDQGDWKFLIPMLVAGICTAVQACLYDYHRNQYIDYGIKGEIPIPEKIDVGTRSGRILNFLNGDYEGNQRRLAWTHAKVEDELARRFKGTLPPEAQDEYRKHFYWLVRGWNFLGDNTRFYAIGVTAWLGCLHHYFSFILVVMNIALVLLYILQARADRKFLAKLDELA